MNLTCPKCRRTFANVVLPLYCSCGLITRSPSDDGNPATHWRELHRMAFDVKNWETIPEQFADWKRRIPARCGCATKFSRLLRKYPPEFSSRAAFFQWAWQIHLAANAPLNDPRHARPTLAGAYAIWTEQLVAPEPPPQPFNVEIVVPFHAGDAYLVAECIAALRSQTNVAPTIHAVADGCEFPADMPPSPELIRYRTPGQWGPYRIANAISRRCRAQWFALQDADDIPYPDRLGRQIATLIEADAEHISNAMIMGHAGELDEYLKGRVAREKLLTPGKLWRDTPRGACVNSVRTMRLATFRALNGFADWFCSADWDFDNRLAFSRVRSLHSQTVVAIRRLHAASITNAPPLRNGSPGRAKFSQLIRDRLHQLRTAPPESVATLAAQQGDLHTAPELLPYE